MEFDRGHATDQQASDTNQQEDDVKMELREDELCWAHEIKAAIKNSSQLNNISDYEVAQWAIVTVSRQDLDEVLDRAYRLQCFVEEHRLHQNPDKTYADEGVEILQEFSQLMPGYLLSVDYMPSQGHYVLIFDKSSFTPETIVTPRNWTALLGSFYFLFQLMNSHLAAVREGLALINECMGMGFQNYSQHMEERLVNDFVGYAPLIHKKSMWLNSPTVANVLMACLKPFMRDEMYQQVQMGCKLDGYEDKINGLFQSPTPERAKEALLVKIHGYLEERENNSKHYQLPPPPAASPTEGLPDGAES